MSATITLSVPQDALPAVLSVFEQAVSACRNVQASSSNAEISNKPAADQLAMAVNRSAMSTPQQPHRLAPPSNDAKSGRAGEITMSTFTQRRRSWISAHSGPADCSPAAEQEALNSPTRKQQPGATAMSSASAWSAEKLIATTPHVRELLLDVKRDQRRKRGLGRWESALWASAGGGGRDSRRREAGVEDAAAAFTQAHVRGYLTRRGFYLARSIPTKSRAGAGTSENASDCRGKACSGTKVTSSSTVGASGSAANRRKSVTKAIADEASSVLNAIVNGPENEREKEAARGGRESINGRPSAPPRCMINPRRPLRRLWDIIGLAFTLITVIMLPLQFAFEIELALNLGVLVLMAIADIFFLVDLVVNFRTGYIEPHSGKLDLDPRSAAIRYVRTWFLPDFLAAAFPMDLVGLGLVFAWGVHTLNSVSSANINSNDLRAMALMQSFRTLRIVRLPKFLRVLRVVQLRGVEFDLLAAPSTITLLKCVFFNALFWHWSGLLWWVIGGEATIDDDFGPPTSLHNSTLGHKYMSAMYWIIAVSSKVRDPLPIGGAYPLDQTMFTNSVIVLGMFLQALLVGAASSVVQSLDSTGAEYARRLSRIKSYLNYKGVPPSLQRRVMFYYRFMWTSMGSLDEANVLPRLPAPLKAQMDIVLTRKIFVSIPVFHSCQPEEILRMVQGLVPHLALPGDVIIEEGTIGLGLFFIMRGAVIVVRKLNEVRLSDTGEVLREEELDELTEGFFGEETVIYGRPASATVRATKHSDFFLLPMAVFDAIVEGNATMRKQVVEYAEGRSLSSSMRKVKAAAKRSHASNGLVSSCRLSSRSLLSAARESAYAPASEAGARQSRVHPECGGGGGG